VECRAGDGHTQGVAYAQDLKPSQREGPRSVVYGRLLLSLQACLWAVVVVPAAAIVALNIPANVDHRTGGHAAVFIGVSIVALLMLQGMSAASAYLAANLRPGRTSIRRGVIAVEAFMTCFGLLLAYAEASTGAGLIAALPVAAGLVGTMLSLTAAVALLSKAARSFTRSVKPA
jgi:hypothetical protein